MPAEDDPRRPLPKKRTPGRSSSAAPRAVRVVRAAQVPGALRAVAWVVACGRLQSDREEPVDSAAGDRHRPVRRGVPALSRSGRSGERGRAVDLALGCGRSWLGAAEVPPGPGVRWWRWYAGGLVGVLVVGVGVFLLAGGDGAGSCQRVSGNVKDTRMKRTWGICSSVPTGRGSGCTRRRRSVARSRFWRPIPAGSSAGRAASGIRAGTTSGTTRRGPLDPDARAGRVGYVPASDLRVGRAPDPAITRRC